MSTPKSVTNYLKDQLVEVNAELEMVNIEYNDIQERAETLVKKRDALQILINDLPDNVKEQGQESEEDDVDSASVNINTDVAQAYSRLGIRDAIRLTLHNASTGLRPKDVTKTLKNYGYQSSGSTDMSIRVANEMGRMKRTKKLIQSHSGRYRLPKDTNFEIFN